MYYYMSDNVLSAFTCINSFSQPTFGSGQCHIPSLQMRKLILITHLPSFFMTGQWQNHSLNPGSGAHSLYIVLFFTIFQYLNSNSGKELSVDLPAIAICWFLPNSPLLQVCLLLFHHELFYKMPILRGEQTLIIRQFYSSFHTFHGFLFQFKGLCSKTKIKLYSFQFRAQGEPSQSVAFC